MSAKPFLYLALADQDWIARFKTSLHEAFELNVFTDAASCQAALNDRQPDAVVLDTRLTDSDVFAMHRAVRDDFMTGDVYQLLLCDEATANREDCVADDFLVVPCTPETLRTKLTRLRDTMAARARTNEQMRYAQHVALTAMSSMGELGVVMQFLTKSFECSDMAAVAQLGVDSLRQYELDGVIHLVWEGDHVSVATREGGPAEADMAHIQQMRTLGRILEVDGQLFINFDHVSVMVCAMPDDAERCGRIRDNLATLAEGIEARVRGLLMENDNLLKQQGIRYAVTEIRDSVRRLYARQIEDTEASHAMVTEVIDHFEEAFVHVGLDPQTENQLINQLMDLRHGVINVIDRPDTVSQKLHDVVQSLETLAGEVGI